MREYIGEIRTKRSLLMLLPLVVLILLSSLPLVLGPGLKESAAATQNEHQDKKAQDHSEPTPAGNQEHDKATAEGASSHGEEESKATKYPIWQDFCAFFLAVFLIMGAYALIKRRAAQPGGD